MTKQRPIDEIAAELFNHPDFVVGNFLSKDHVDDDVLAKLDDGFAEDCYDALSTRMYELIDNAVSPAQY